jgi:hypothetical protein
MCRRVNSGSQGGEIQKHFGGIVLLWQLTPSPWTNRNSNLETPENVWVCAETNPYAQSCWWRTRIQTSGQQGTPYRKPVFINKRRIDLNSYLLPKEIRRNLRIREQLAGSLHLLISFTWNCNYYSRLKEIMRIARIIVSLLWKWSLLFCPSRHT